MDACTIPPKRPGSFAQLGQDLDVVNAFGGLREGYFVDVGASDGITYSNTYLLENAYGWKGICVEPVPEEYQKLVQCRPGSICVGSPMLDVSGKEVLFRVSEQYSDADNNIIRGTLLSGIEDYLKAHPSAQEGKPLTMHTQTLTEVLDRYEAPAVMDYLSLDTEGSELLILQGLDWKRYTFRLIHVEHNLIEPNRLHIREFLEGKGYRFVRQNQWDDEYEHTVYTTPNHPPVSIP